MDQTQKRFYMIFGVILSLGLSEITNAADAIDSTFTSPKIVIFSTVTRVHQYQGRAGTSSTNYVNDTVIKGTDSEGNIVRLTLRKSTTDTAFEAFAEDCAKKGSLAMASPSTLSFRYTVEPGGAGVSSDAGVTTGHIITRSVQLGVHEARCSLAPAGDSSDSE